MRLRVSAVRGFSCDRFESFYVLMARAGRTDRTGAKVHRGTVTHWKQADNPAHVGNVTTGSTCCSANGHLRGSVIYDDRRAVAAGITCLKCGINPEYAAANAVILTIENGKLVNVEAAPAAEVTK